MKSRKLGMFAKRSSKRDTSAKLRQSRQTLRKGLLEKLEDRQLMATDLQPYSDGKFYPIQGLFAGDLVGGLSAQEYVRRSMATGAQGSNTVGGAGEDATSGRSTSVTEVEPNNNFNVATFVPLGTSGNKAPIVNITGNLGPQVILPQIGSVVEEDWYSMDLRAGDIVDVKLVGSPGVIFDVTLLNSTRNEIAGRLDSEAPLGFGFLSSYPPSSPLSYNGNNSFAYTVSTSGRYYVRVGDGFGGYNLTLKTYRPTLEKQPIGTMQKVFVDFDGARVNANTFGFSLAGFGTIRLSPMTNYFQQAGFQPQDEEPFIRAFMSYLKENFQGSLSALATNGLRSADGINGHFDIEWLNSFDNPDPGNDPLVTRLIVGGDGFQFPLPVRGISNAIDIGNFETAGTVIVLPDVYMNPLSGDYIGAVPRAANATQLDATAKAMAATASHELGHNFGAWHQDNSNTVITLMDQGGLPIGPSRLGVGIDGIYGTTDDIDIDFGKDVYDPIEGNIGVEDTAGLMAYALSTGTVGGGSITGTVYIDKNLSRTKDANEAGVLGVRVYADINSDGTYNSGEPFAFTDAAGYYTIGIVAGTYKIREVVPTGYRLTTPVAGFTSVTVTGTSTVNNINFGQEQLSYNATGVKFNDANGNGLRDTGEGTIAGVRMYLDLDGDKRIDIGEPSARSNEFGEYTLTFPGPGTYKIREVVDAGYVQTYPNAASNYEHTVVVTGNPVIDAPNLAGLNFGNKLTVDFGDAPATFGDASAGFAAGLLLGANWDDEQSSQYSATAQGDDNAGKLDVNGLVIDDEDGIVFTRPLVAGNSNNRISVTAVNTTGVSAYLNGWIDFNQDGDFNDSGEKIFTNTVVGTGSTSLAFAAPATAKLGSTFARFRYSSERDVGPTGRSLGGEVEDYRVSVVATLELAVDDRYTVARSSTSQVLDVLANDFALPGEQLEIVSASASAAGGVVQIGIDNKIRYTPPAGFIGQDFFTYTMRNSSGETDTANVIVDVKLFFPNPVAVDDSYDIALNAIDSPLNVLANDIEGSTGALTIIAITQPNGGGQISIASGGKSLRYTPVRGFQGTESFTYIASDASGKQTTAEVTLHILPLLNENSDVEYSLRTTDLSGNVITSVKQGQDFRLEVFVDDFRNNRGVNVQSPGVFAAYMDLLYNLQLVSTAQPKVGSGFNFDVTFLNSYTNFQDGNAAVPGIIDEFGAVYNLNGDPNNPGTMNFPDPVKLATITFTARSPGIAKFSTDPADDSPANDTLLFDTPGSEVPVPRIRFRTASIEIVGDSDEFPVAVDDSLVSAIPFGALQFPINVIANDLPGSTGKITVVGVNGAQNGFATIDGQNNRVLYTPNSGFSGTDQFTYTIEDARGIQSQARVTVRIGSSADLNDIVDLRLDVTDLNGQPITTIAVGGQFKLNGYVKDLRGDGVNRGIYAAFQDILYSSALVSPIAKTVTPLDPLGFEVVFGPNYRAFTDGDINTKGLINEIGAVQTSLNDPLGLPEQLLFTVTLVANRVGTATFIGDPVEISPQHDTLTFNPIAVVGFDQIRFGSDSIIITSSGNLGGGEFTNPSIREDVNNDGHVSPIDALIIITQLNSRNGNGEGEATKYFVDVNGDRNVSAIDALLVINRLNKTRGAGEGEAGGQLQQLLSGGVLATSNGIIDASLEFNPVATALLTAAASPTIGARDTGAVYGPFFSDSTSSSIDSVFGEGESGIDELLAQLAPDVEQTRKKL